VWLRQVVEDLGEFTARLHRGDPRRALAVLVKIDPAEAHVLTERLQSGLPVEVADPEVR